MIQVALLSKWHVHAEGYGQQFAKIPGVKIAVVWDEDPVRGKEWADSIGCDFEPDLETAVNRKDVDAVSVGTPTSMHREVICAAAKAGKAIFTEKVLAITNEDAETISKAVDEAKVPFLISFRRRTDAPILEAKHLVESGAIDCIWGCFSMDGREEVYRWAGPYMVSRQVVAVDAHSSIRSLSDLAGKTVAVQSTGKPEEIFLSGSDPRIPQTVEVLSIENRSVQYAMLACGYVDGIAAHETGILQYMKDNAVDFRILEEPLLVTGLGIAFAKNDTRGLDSQLTDTLAQMRADGTLERIIGRYLENASQYLEVDTIGA